MNDADERALLESRAIWLRQRIEHHRESAEDCIRDAQHRYTGEKSIACSSRASAHATLAQSYQRELHEVEDSLIDADRASRHPHAGDTSVWTPTLDTPDFDLEGSC